jgi:hypothetical protein
MAAHEHQPEHVVAIIRLVDRFGQFRLAVAIVGNRLLRRQFGQPAGLALLVDAGIAADQHQPGDGIARRPVLRPVPKRPRQAFWNASSAVSRSRK